MEVVRLSIVPRRLKGQDASGRLDFEGHYHFQMREKCSQEQMYLIRRIQRLMLYA